MLDLEITVPPEAAGELANRVMAVWPDQEVTTQNGSLHFQLPIDERLDYQLSLLEEILQKVEEHRNLDLLQVISRNVHGPDSAPEIQPLGDFLICHPESENEPQPEPGQTIIRLDAGCAFGTGGHPSTILVLNALHEYFNPPPGAPSHKGATVLDVGTGTGLLALAAAKLGAGRVLAIDPSPTAVEAARYNCRLNGLDNLIEVEQTTADKLTGQFDLILANLIPSVLIRSAKKLNPLLSQEGALILSGFADTQTPQVVKVTTKLGWCCIKSYSRDGWTALSLIR